RPDIHITANRIKMIIPCAIADQNTFPLLPMASWLAVQYTAHAFQRCQEAAFCRQKQLDIPRYGINIYLLRCGYAIYLYITADIIAKDIAKIALCAQFTGYRIIMQRI